MLSMKLGYWLMYTLGFKPWEDAEAPERLRNLIEGPEALAKGRALDIGCGTGASSIYLTKKGWEVVGVDFMPKALAQARVNAGRAGVSVRFLTGDVTQLQRLDLGGPFQLFVDRGCFHGLTDPQRRACAEGVTSLASPGAILQLFAFHPNHLPVLPRGISKPDLQKHYAHWDLVADGAIERAGPVPMSWYRFRKRA
jgi:SAM-dependent methyltransferase